MTRWMTPLQRQVRRQLRQLQRYVEDLIAGDLAKLMGSDAPRAGHSFARQISYQQPIRNSEGAAEKRHNIRLAARSFAGRVLAPGDLFSLWHLVGHPSRSRGYRAGRSIIDGEVVRDPGGGLCQLAGVLHVLAIKAGLAIVESHAHSRDLYDEQTRYAPLGSDAAVAYAFKDFRVANHLDQPVSFDVEVRRDTIVAHITSPKPITEYSASFVRHDAPNQRLAAAYRCGEEPAQRELVRLARYSVSSR